MKDRWAILILLLIFGSSTYAQSNLGIQGNGNMVHVLLDNEVLNETPDSIVKVYALKSGNYKLSIQTSDSVSCSKSILLEDNTEHWFEVKVDSIRGCRIKFYNTIPAEHSDTITTGRTIIGATPMANNREQVSPVTFASNEMNTSISEMDSSMVDSLTITPIKMYTGRVGCSIPTDDLSKEMAQLRNEEFSSRRLKKLKSILAGKCMWVEDVNQIMGLFEFEDHKLEVFDMAQNSIYDLDNIPTLEKQFKFKRNKEKFKTYAK